MANLISIADLDKAAILSILDLAEHYKQTPTQTTLNNRVIASCFFEPSTRTRLSFETAICRSGGKVIGFSDSQNTSQKKGETLEDTIRMLAGYADAIIMRHPEAGSAARAAAVSDKPIINAGDGGNQHPTQTLLDLFTIRECHGKLEGLTIALVGDLKHGRTVHSLALAGALFNMRFEFIAPEALQMPEHICQQLQNHGIQFQQNETLEPVLEHTDILYMTRLQTERLQGLNIKNNPYQLTAQHLQKAKASLKVLHPLPRVDEIATDVDACPQAYYFQQAANGVPVRQALLEWLL